MRNRNVAFALGLVIAAVLLQSALFGEGRIHPLRSSPNLTVVVLVATARYLVPEPALLVGFTAGMLMDLLGGSPLGLWALSLTVVAFLTLRIRDRADSGIVSVAIGVFALSVVGQTLFGVVGTLFGQRFFTNPGVLRLMIVPAAFNVLLAALVVPLATRVMRVQDPSRWLT